MSDALYEMYKSVDPEATPQKWFMANGQPSNFFAYTDPTTNDVLFCSRNPDGSVKIEDASSVK